MTISPRSEALLMVLVVVGGGLAGYYLGGIYLRRQWERFLEGE